MITIAGLFSAIARVASAKTLHVRLLKSVMRAPIAFYDVGVDDDDVVCDVFELLLSCCCWWW